MELRLEYVPLDKIKKWPRNPRIHSPRLGKLFEKYGFLKPLLLDEASGRLVAGHGRIDELIRKRDVGEDPPDGLKIIGTQWRVPVLRGKSFASEKEAEEFLYDDNLSTDEASWVEEEFNDITKDLDLVISDLTTVSDELDDTGMNIDDLDEIGDDIEDLDEDITEAEEDKDESEVHEQPGKDPEKKEKKLDAQQKYDQIPSELEGVFNLDESATFLPEYDDFDITRHIESKGIDLQIPRLRPDMLVEKLPEPLEVWGDYKKSEDDGKKYWLWNYGSASWPVEYDSDTGEYSAKNMDRVILSMFTHDVHINTWWKETSYRVGQILVAGCRMAVVPDVSLWEDSPAILHAYSVYRAAWFGRFFQEAGIKIIPRIEYFMDKSKPFSLVGIPKYAPVVATQFHTKFPDSRVAKLRSDLREAIEIVQPDTLLVYASDRGKDLVEGTSLNCKIKILNVTAAKVRKPKHKESNPHLLELRKRKKDKEGDHDT